MRRGRLRGWVVVYAPICDNGDEYGKQSFENENPCPCGFMTDAVLSMKTSVKLCR
jgi:hypothetical protein